MKTCVQIRRPGQDEDSTKKTKSPATIPPATIKKYTVFSDYTLPVTPEPRYHGPKAHNR